MLYFGSHVPILWWYTSASGAAQYGQTLQTNGQYTEKADRYPNRNAENNKCINNQKGTNIPQYMWSVVKAKYKNVIMWCDQLTWLCNPWVGDKLVKFMLHVHPISFFFFFLWWLSNSELSTWRTKYLSSGCKDGIQFMIITYDWFKRRIHKFETLNIRLSSVASRERVQKYHTFLISSVRVEKLTEISFSMGFGGKRGWGTHMCFL